MPNDKIHEFARRLLVRATNDREYSREQLERIHTFVWNTNELTRDFAVHSFAAPFVMVTRNSDGAKGSLMFQNRPKLYFAFAVSE